MMTYKGTNNAAVMATIIGNTIIGVAMIAGITTVICRINKR